MSFDWKSTGAADVGLIAEEVATILPDLVIRDADGRPDGVKYDKLAVYLLGVIKTQREQLAAQQSEIATQQNELTDLRARLERIEAALGTQATFQTGGDR